MEFPSAFPKERDQFFFGQIARFNQIVMLPHRLWECDGNWFWIEIGMYLFKPIDYEIGLVGRLKATCLDFLDIAVNHEATKGDTLAYEPQL